MNETSELENLLQNAIDELFALQKQAADDRQKFLADSVTLIKAAHQQVNDSVQAAVRAEGAARESAASAKHASLTAYDSQSDLKAWQKALFWLGVGYCSVGIVLGSFYFYLGKQIEFRIYELSLLRSQVLTAKLKHKTASHPVPEDEGESER